MLLLQLCNNVMPERERSGNNDCLSWLMISRRGTNNPSLFLVSEPATHSAALCKVFWLAVDCSPLCLSLSGLLPDLVDLAREL